MNDKPVGLRPYACGPVRELSAWERATWAKCPRCRAEHGKPCIVADELHGGVSARDDLEMPLDGVHSERLERAPMKVREVPVQT